ncbi:Hint domain-containing protein [Roseivivax sp. CAU 1761]
MHPSPNLRSARALTARDLLPETPAPSAPAPRRRPPLMRRYEAAYLQPDLTAAWHQVTAPAIPAFEHAAAAFARGTLVQTVTGPTAIEDLMPGDYIETERGPEPVLWIGSTAFVPKVPEGESGLTELVRVLADGFGPARPAVDMVLGPGARMVIESPHLARLVGQSRVVVPVSDFVDGDRLVPVRPAGPVQLYHIALARHAVIRVAGVEMESYHPGTAIKKALGEALTPTFLKLFPNLRDFADFGELSLPRTSREVLETLESR